MIMDQWELLSKIDHEMMQVDIDLMEWQGNLDMAALAGVGQPFEVWTNDDPPVVVTEDNFEDFAGKPVRLMTFSNGQWTKLGDGTMTPTGKFHVWIHKPKSFLEYDKIVSIPGSGVVEIPDPENHPFFNKE